MHNFGYFEEEYKSAIGGDRSLWRRLLLCIRPYPWPFCAALLLSLLATGSSLGLPWIMQGAIDRFMTGQQETAQRLTGLTTAALYYGGLALLNFAALFFQVLILEWLGQTIMNTMRCDLFSHLLGMDLPFFARHATGRLVTRLTNDIQNMHEMFTSVVVTICNDFLRMVCILALLIYMNHRLGLLMTLFVPLAAALTILFSRYARRHFRAIRQQLARLNAYLQETVSGLILVGLFGRGRDTAQSFDQLNEEYLVRTLRQIRLFGTFMPLTELMHTMAIAAVLWYGGGEIIRKQLSLGELTAFLSYMRLFFQPLRELSQKYSIVQSALASAERIFHLQDLRSAEAEDNLQPLPARALRGELRLDQVFFSYDGENPALKDISLHISPGETVAIVGPSGSGKTTLINLLLRFYEPSSGSLYLAGRDLSTIPRHQLRQVIGVVQQEILILPDSLFHNIVLDSGTNRETVEKLLETTRLVDFSRRLPQGLDTMIGEGGQAMSTGEKQLLAMARILCRQPVVVILDEASSAIDSQTEQLVEQSLTQCFRNTTMLIIAHRLSTVRRADRILVMAGGRIAEEGTHDVLLARDGLYSELVAVDFAD